MSATRKLHGGAKADNAQNYKMRVLRPVIFSKSAVRNSNTALWTARHCRFVRLAQSFHLLLRDGIGAADVYALKR
jgi:hypothetical protein